jgi:hypothetical protein
MPTKYTPMATTICLEIAYAVDVVTEVLVRTRRCSICSLDFAAFPGGYLEKDDIYAKGQESFNGG